MQTTKADRPLSRGEAVTIRCIRILDKILQTATDLTFILVLLVGLYFLADTVHVFYNARAGVTMPYKPAPSDNTAEVLRELSKDCVGWVTLDNTSIDYPVMQGIDNYEYLNKDPYGVYSLAGSVFLDCRNAPDFSDDYSILYGHHMSGGFMFGALDAYEEETYFNEHLTGTLFTARGNFPIRVLAFLHTDANNELVFDAEHEESHTLPDWIREHAELYNAPAEGGRIVALSTCKSPTSTRRMIVFVTIEESEDEE